MFFGEGAPIRIGSAAPLTFERLGELREDICVLRKEVCSEVVFLLVVRGRGGNAVELYVEPSFKMLTY